MMYNLSNGWIGRHEWVNDHSKIKTEWFYEDSIIAEVENIEVFGNVASVYRNVSAYVLDIKAQRGGFHSIVEKQMGDTVNAKAMFFKAYDISRTLASDPEDFFILHKAEVLN